MTFLLSNFYWAAHQLMTKMLDIDIGYTMKAKDNNFENNFTMGPKKYVCPNKFITSRVSTCMDFAHSNCA